MIRLGVLGEQLCLSSVTSLDAVPFLKAIHPFHLIHLQIIHSTEQAERI